MAVEAKPTQNFVPIKEIKDGVAVLTDNTLVSVVLASSVNIALKSEDEQSAILLQFQNFLNSLDFSIQIVIQSRDLDIRPYIALLQERHAEQTIDIVKLQTKEYIEFIKGFVETTNIMSKNFFVVVPYIPSVINASDGGIMGKLGGIGKSKNTSKSNKKASAFEENKSQLEQRMSVVEQGLSRTGIRVARLGTEELVELFYKTLNPGELGKPITLEKK